MRCSSKWCKNEAKYVCSNTIGERQYLCENHAVLIWEFLTSKFRGLINLSGENRTQDQRDRELAISRKRFLEAVARGVKMEPREDRRPSMNDDLISQRQPLQSVVDMVKRANVVLAERGRMLRYRDGNWHMDIL